MKQFHQSKAGAFLLCSMFTMQLVHSFRWLVISLVFQIGCFSLLEGAAESDIIKVNFAGQQFDLSKQVLSKMPYFRALLNPDLYLQSIPMYRDYRSDLTSHSALAQSQGVVLSVPPGVTRDHMLFLYNQLRRIPMQSDITVDMVFNEIKKEQPTPARMKELLASAEKLLLSQSIPSALDVLWASMIQRRLVRPDGKISRAFFAPNDRLLETILGLIKAEKKHIRVACYFMTNKEILCELARAKKRGVRVEVIVDANSPEEGIKGMQRAGLYSYLWGRRWFGSEPLMHNKFFIFDDNINNQPILVTGSANCTWRAQGLNEENIVVMNDRKLVDKFAQRFGHLRSFAQSGYIEPAPWEVTERYIKNCIQIDALRLERITPQAFWLWQALARLYAMYLLQGQVDRFGLTDESEIEVKKQLNELKRQ